MVRLVELSHFKWIRPVCFYYTSVGSGFLVNKRCLSALHPRVERRNRVTLHKGFSAQIEHTHTATVTRALIQVPNIMGGARHFFIAPSGGVANEAFLVARGRLIAVP